jgi:hypothetical protein
VGLQGSRRCSVLIVVSTEKTTHINILDLFFLLFFDLLNGGGGTTGGCWSCGWSSGSTGIEHLSDVGVFESLSEEFWPVSINVILGRFDDCG